MRRSALIGSVATALMLASWWASGWSRCDMAVMVGVTVVGNLFIFALTRH